MKLLSRGSANVKLAKSESKELSIFNLSLRPADLSGYEVCPWRGKCAKMCVLEEAGRGMMKKVRRARTKKTVMVFEDRHEFKRLLLHELTNANKLIKRKGIQCGIRLNTGSDLPWEYMIPEILSEFPHLWFYDYTKSMKRALDQHKNYELTYSYNEESNWDECENLLEWGHNIAVVFDTRSSPFPKVWRGYQTVSGDDNDVRLKRFDGYGKIIALRAKGSNAKVDEGIQDKFVQLTGVTTT